MLDTNVLVKFAFVLNKIYSNKSLSKSLKKYELILDKLETGKFQNVMSDWNKTELRDVLMRLKLAEIFFLSGYSVDEFNDAKEEGVRLSPKDINSVNKIVFEIWKFCERSTAKDMNRRKIETWTKRDYSTMDIILLHQAELHACDYFVTNDRKLYLSSELKRNFEVKICSVNEFKSKL